MRAIVSLGSNLGDREGYLLKALSMLSSLPKTTLVKKSSILETNPIDVPKEYEDLKFLNQIVIFESGLSAEEFSFEMHKIEDILGRVRTVVNAPRTIDIDLIDFGGLKISTPSLTLPHPRAFSRSFIHTLLQEVIKT